MDTSGTSLDHDLNKLTEEHQILKIGHFDYKLEYGLRLEAQLLCLASG